MGNHTSDSQIDPTTNLKLVQQYETHRVFADHSGNYYDKYLLNIDRSSMETYIYEFRKKNKYNFVVDTYYSDYRTNFFGCQDTSYNYEVVTQHISQRLSQMEDLNFWDATNILKKSLKGFNVIHKYNGAFEVSSQMIGLNYKKQVKVWLSKNLWKNSMDSTYLKLIQQSFKKKEAIMINSIIQLVNMKAIQSPQWKQLIFQLQSNEELLNYIDCQPHIESYCNTIKYSPQNMMMLANNQQIAIQRKPFQPKKLMVSQKASKYPLSLSYSPQCLSQRKKIFSTKQQQQYPQTDQNNNCQIHYLNSKPISPKSFISNGGKSLFQDYQNMNKIQLKIQNSSFRDNPSDVLKKQNTAPIFKSYKNYKLTKNSRGQSIPRPQTMHPIRFSHNNNFGFLYENSEVFNQPSYNKSEIKTLTNAHNNYTYARSQNPIRQRKIFESERDTTSKQSNRQKISSNHLDQKQIRISLNQVHNNDYKISKGHSKEKRYSGITKSQNVEKQFQNYWRKQINIFKKNKEINPKKQIICNQNEREHQLCEQQAILGNPYANKQVH